MIKIKKIVLIIKINEAIDDILYFMLRMYLGTFAATSRYSSKSQEMLREKCLINFNKYRGELNI